jgi:hypothetical protein
VTVGRELILQHFGPISRIALLIKAKVPVHRWWLNSVEL